MALQNLRVSSAKGARGLSEGVVQSSPFQFLGKVCLSRPFSTFAGLTNCDVWPSGRTGYDMLAVGQKRKNDDPKPAVFVGVFFLTHGHAGYNPSSASIIFAWSPAASKTRVMAFVLKLSLWGQDTTSKISKIDDFPKIFSKTALKIDKRRLHLADHLFTSNDISSLPWEPGVAASHLESWTNRPGRSIRSRCSTRGLDPAPRVAWCIRKKPWKNTNSRVG